MLGGNSAGIYGYSALTGDYPGLQAEYARIALADHNLLKVPAQVPDEVAVLLSDVLPTAY
jgi:threonine dehydrogenase-like Zn-dependent dehydrogenase